MPLQAPARPLLAAALLLTVVLLPVAASQADERHVPQSLWGVKGDVGLTVLEELLTNHADRSWWQARPTGDGVRVGVIDTGIDLSHPDLEGSLACGYCWRDFVGEGAEPYDNHGHGTHVAGIIAGRGHWQVNPLNSYFPTGARGMATGAELIVAKAMNSTGGGDDSRVAEAIEWALDPDGDPTTEDGAQIIHLSLGVRSPDDMDGQVRAGSETEEVVREAIERGVFVIMSAGNQADQGPATPGQVPGVIAVGALDADGELLSFTNRGEGVDVYAPGVVMSAWPAGLDEDGIRDGYTGLAGTSQAAPVVTGGLALAIGANPELAQGGGATKVTHIEDLVRSTGERFEPGVVRFDAAGLLETQDLGTSKVAWTVVGTVALFTLIVLGIAGRLAFRLLRKHAHEYSERQPGDRTPGAQRATQQPSSEDERSGELEPASSETGGDVSEDASARSFGRPQDDDLRP